MAVLVSPSDVKLRRPRTLRPHVAPVAQPVGDDAVLSARDGQVVGVAFHGVVVLFQALAGRRRSPTAPTD